MVQTNGSLSQGVFHDLSPVVSAGGAGASTTNYVHTNGVHTGAGFYRVRLGP